MTEKSEDANDKTVLDIFMQTSVWLGSSWVLIPSFVTPFYEAEWLSKAHLNEVFELQINAARGLLLVTGWTIHQTRNARISRWPT
jgi:hypothetical protein